MSLGGGGEAYGECNPRGPGGVGWDFPLRVGARPPAFLAQKPGNPPPHDPCSTLCCPPPTRADPPVVFSVARVCNLPFLFAPPPMSRNMPPRSLCGVCKAAKGERVSLSMCRVAFPFPTAGPDVNPTPKGLHGCINPVLNFTLACLLFGPLCCIKKCSLPGTVGLKSTLQMFFQY